MYNKVILIGNLTREIAFHRSQSGMAIAKTAIAINRKFRLNTGEQKEEICFVDITFFGRSAEVAHQYLHKGSKILIEGRLIFEQWTNQNGQKRSKHSVTVDIMQMLDSKVVVNISDISNAIRVQPTSNINITEDDIPF
jgi:single-strand DNA-binding protein